jgi:hypothetical protein
MDADSNCTDFQLQLATILPVGWTAGAIDIKVASVTGFAAGQTLMIDTGASVETAVIASVGSSGAATTAAPTSAGASAIPVIAAAGFSVGQTITVDTGTNQESAMIASVTGGRGGTSITVTTPLRITHAPGVQVSGSGITLTTPLGRPHADGTQVIVNLPTPGAPNRYSGLGDKR